MKIDNHLLVRNVLSPDRQVQISCQEISIETIDQEVAVWWKSVRHWKRTNEIGDGMELVRVHTRPVLSQQIDPQLFLYGLSPRQEYDENTNEVTVYAYKFPKDDETISSANSLIQQIIPELSLKSDGRFVVVEGNTVWLLDIRSIENQLKGESTEGIISFLIGLLIIYGEVHSEWNVIHNATIHISLLWPLAMRNEIIMYCLQRLREDGVYTTNSLLTQREGQLLQITIADREFLETFSSLFRISMPDIVVSGHELSHLQKKSLIAFLSTESDGVAMSKTIEDSVLKTVRK